MLTYPLCWLLFNKIKLPAEWGTCPLAPWDAGQGWAALPAGPWCSWCESILLYPEPRACHSPALCAAKQTAGSILEGSPSLLLLCRDDSFIQHYSAQVSSQEARVYGVHHLKAKITFIPCSKSRAEQTKRDNRTVAKAKQWNLEDVGQLDTLLLQFPSMRRAMMAFIAGWCWPRLSTIMASSIHHHLTHGHSITHPASALTSQSRQKDFSYPLILIRHRSYFSETFHQWPCGTNSPEPAARESRSATSPAHQFKKGRWSAILGSEGKGKTVFKSGTTKYRLLPCKHSISMD